MSTESIQNNNKEIFDIKMNIQKRLIERSHIGSGEDRTEHGLNWIDEYAEQFSEIFNQKIVDPEFLEFCKSDFENAVKQIETELWLTAPAEHEGDKKLAA